MRTLIRDPREVTEISPKRDDQRRTYASERPVADVLDDGIVEGRDGHPLLLVATLPEGVHRECDLLLDWLSAFRGWQGTEQRPNEFRMSGIQNAHVVFGYSPPVPLRRRYGASVCDFTLSNPGATMALEALAGACAEAFAERMPTAYARHLEAISALDPAWLLGGGKLPWTSGIINRTSALPYHKDASNVAGSMSAMVVLRSSSEGGGLHVPALDVLLPCGNRSLNIFDGCRHLHGTTPLARERYTERFSIVFYTKREFVGAEKPGDEVRRAQRRATEAAENLGSSSKQVALDRARRPGDRRNAYDE